MNDQVESMRTALALLKAYGERDEVGFKVLLNDCDHRDVLCAMMRWVGKAIDLPATVPHLTELLAALNETQAGC
jgi:hypothetical protein